MSFIARLQGNLQPNPSRDFVKIGTLIHKRVITDGLEKTAAVQAKIAEQETEILVSFYKAAHALSPDSPVADAFFAGGAQLYGANNPGQSPSGESLYKLAAVGMINDKLQAALKTPGLDKEAHQHIVKLGQENNHHTLALLADLVLTKEGEGRGSGSAGGAGSAGLRDARAQNVADTFAGDSAGSAPRVTLGDRITGGLKADKSVTISGARSNGAPGGGGGMMTGGGKTTVNHIGGSKSRSIDSSVGGGGIGGGVGTGKGAPTLSAGGSKSGPDYDNDFYFARGYNPSMKSKINEMHGLGYGKDQIRPYIESGNNDSHANKWMPFPKLGKK